MKRWLVFTFLFWTIVGAKAQLVAGQVVDEEQRPLEFVNVVLLSLPDSTFVRGVVTDQDGRFSLLSEKSNGLIRFSSVGYATCYRNCGTGSMDLVRMTSDAQMLGEVVVKGNLPQTSLKGGAMITGVAGTVLEKVGTAENLLNKIPGVTAEGGSVNVFGRGAPEIYINGRKVHDTSELDKLASDNIKSVEVVNSPGARYAASVKAVIRITTKKALGDGFGFSNRFQTNYRYGWMLLDQFDFNYRKEGLDLTGMLSGYDAHGGQDKTMIQETFLDKQWHQQSDITNDTHNQTLSGMFSVNYRLNKNHAWGARYNYDRTPKMYWELNMPATVLMDGELYETSMNISRENTRSTGHRVNFYYNGKAGKWNIDFNADGLWNELNVPTWGTEETTPNGGTTEYRTITTLGQKQNALYAAKVVLSHPLWGGDLSFGGEYSHNSRTNRYANEEGILAGDDSEIKEDLLGVFADYNRSFGKVDVLAGVRYEHVISDYYKQQMRVAEQCKEYNNVFPSFSLSFPIGKTRMQVSYAADITRPGYNQLRGNVTYANRYTYEGGNPFLKPTLSHNLSLQGSYKWIYASVGYRRIKDGIMNSCDAYSKENPTIALLWWTNVPAYDVADALVSLRPKFGFWKPQFVVQVQQQWYTTDTPDGRQCLNHPIGTFLWQNSLELPAGFLLNADASFATRGHFGNVAVDKTSWGVNLSLYKEFAQKRISCQLQATDIFQTKVDYVTVYSGVRTMTLNTDARRGFMFTVRYKFNSARNNYKGTGAGESQKSRM